MRSICIALGAAAALSLVLWASAYALDQGLDITGDVRLRLRHVDSADSGALSGTYGESLGEGYSLKHRFVLEAAYPLTDEVKVGGMIRVSNEGREVLLAGPDYLSSELGSAFIAYETPTLRSQLGYYSTSYTPLTLMRWDVEDDPEGGGGGCGCAGAPSVAGAILGETLEELGPALTFEGVRASVTPGGTFGLDGFLARPRTADADYQMITTGGRASLTRYALRTSSFFDLGLVAVRSAEDENSLESLHRAGVRPFKNTVCGITWSVPIVKALSLGGEWTLTKSAGDPRDLSCVRTDGETVACADKQGKGGIVSLDLRPSKSIKAEASYLYLSPNWESYFRALSYNPNREGLRVRLEVARGPVVVAAFARYLRTIYPALPSGSPAPAEDAKKMAHPTFSLRTYLKLSPALNLGLAGIYSGSGLEDDGPTLALDTKKITLVGTLAFEFARDARITIEERYVSNRIDSSNSTDHNYDVSLISLYVRAAIW